MIGVVIRWNQIPEYIERLPDFLERTVRPGATILAGDYNLRFPGGPRSRELLHVLEQFDLTVHTTGSHESLSDERSLIDHIATSTNIEVGGLTVWPRKDPGYENGTKEVTDHAGAAVEISLASLG